jgi:signal transduction histidine kinase
MLANIVWLYNDNFAIAFEKSYYLSKDYVNYSSEIIQNLSTVNKYKSEEYILSGSTLSKDEIDNAEEDLYRDFEFNSNSYNTRMTNEENYKIFKEDYADKISQAKDQLIKRDLDEFDMALRNIEKYQGLTYYTKNGENEFTNSPNKEIEYFKSFQAYILFNGLKLDVFPNEVNENSHFYWLTSNRYDIGRQEIMYIAFTDEFLNPRIEQWNKDKIVITNNLYLITGYLTVLIIAFIYLILVIGRKPEKDQGVQLNSLDRIYNDFKIGFCLMLIVLWFPVVYQLYHSKITEPIFPVTILIAAAGFILLLSLVKHLKNRTFIKHTLIFSIFHKIYVFIRDIYNSGSVGVKVILIVIGYPALVALTFFIFPLTIGAAAWLALKKVKEFNIIKEGVRKVKDGDIHHKLDISGNGEFAKLAADLNSITDGLHKAVENEIKSERLKTELITNVSHDIRTPLTSIITYVDLLKNEKDQIKISEYLEIIDQKAQRLKVLTDDLFEAAKASSGNIAVNFEKIDLVSLITQGLGELDDKIQDSKLEFKMSYPENKVYIKADGKLLWRAIENLLSNIFKYALTGSRVYIDIIDFGPDVLLIIKNISACELNISPDELMERFIRGDESRSSQGSGLGLSITKSLIEIQKGSFNIEIDGDLFKAIIQMSKADIN